MPAVSQAQRGYLAAKFGPEWMRQHHFDNPGPLPARVDKKRKRSHGKLHHALGGHR
jgi:hypothetical protein